ncbi:MAG: nuclear transport factor 2 family protein [Actinomycetota bacterium]|jgi:hypothetical protein|nr:nuclear transport factor 2 family protein [Actinomycetota bacterium]
MATSRCHHSHGSSPSRPRQRRRRLGRATQRQASHVGELEWIACNDSHAVCRYRFTWTGSINGQPRSGTGRGTNVLINSAGTWQMLHEHLSA